MLARAPEGTSFGTEGILNTISKRDSERSKKNVFLVNLATLLRNALIMDSKDKPMTDKEMVTVCNKDIDYLAEYIGQYASSMREKCHLIFYLKPELLKDIPTEQLRGSQSLMKLQKLIKVATDDWEFKANELYEMNTTGNLTVYRLGVIRRFSHTVAEFAVRSLDTRTTPNIFMISHIPFDFYLFDRFDKLEVIDSVTGNTWKKDHLSKKVFGDANLPFNRANHVLFGDKGFMKGVIRNKKKVITEISKTKKIRLLTSFEFTKLLSQILGTDVKKLIKIKIP